MIKDYKIYTKTKTLQIKARKRCCGRRIWRGAPPFSAVSTVRGSSRPGTLYLGSATPPEAQVPTPPLFQAANQRLDAGADFIYRTPKIISRLAGIQASPAGSPSAGLSKWLRPPLIFGSSTLLIRVRGPNPYWVSVSFRRFRRFPPQRSSFSNSVLSENQSHARRRPSQQAWIWDTP